MPETMSGSLMVPLLQAIHPSASRPSPNVPLRQGYLDLRCGTLAREALLPMRIVSQRAERATGILRLEVNSRSSGLRVRT
jgi:hypothetical protein